jgi:hypothetical protein
MEPLTLFDHMLGARRTSFESPLDIEACLSRLRDQLRPARDPFDREGLDGVVGRRSGRLTRRYRSWLPMRYAGLRDVEVSLVFSDEGGKSRVSSTSDIGLSTKVDLVVTGGMTLVLTPILLLVAWNATELLLRIVAAALVPMLIFVCIGLRAEAFRERDDLLAFAERLVASPVLGTATP